jgi:ABC-2 type transport system ATP-binding protein
MSSSPILSVSDLAKTFSLGFLGAVPGFRRLPISVRGITQRVEAVRGLTFAVDPGEIFGFLGPNGAGKTTTIKMLMGLIRPSGGSATLLGHALEPGNRRQRERIGYLPEQPYFYEHLKPMEFLDFYGGLFPMTARERRQRARELLDRVGLAHALDRPIRKFSKGMVQRIGIAQALINAPDLIVLDEPMSGLDPLGRKEIRDLIFDLKQQGRTVFFSSHILQDVEQICDRVAIVVKGRLKRIGPMASLLEVGAQGVEVLVAGLGAASVATLGLPATALGEAHRFVVPEAEGVDAFVRAVLDLGGRLVSVTPQRRSLEDIFVEEAGRT